MCANDSDIAWLWTRVVKWYILLDGELQHLFLAVCCRTWKFSYVTAWQGVVLDGEE